MAKSIDTANANRLGIYCFYDQNGHAARFIDAFLKALRPYLTDLIVVVNGNLDDAARKLFCNIPTTLSFERMSVWMLQHIDKLCLLLGGRNYPPMTRSFVSMTL